MKDDALDATVSAASTVASHDAPVEGRARELPEVSDHRYAIGAEVGRGGIGRVVKARDQVLERPVALKQLFVTDEGSRRRFIREALITARLQHPSIVPIYEAGRREDRSPFYAMRLVAGQPLERAIAEATTLERRLALIPAVLAVADAIAYAHSERIIHRDLKPANVLVGKYGETVVIDWGLAKDLAIDDRDALPFGPYRARADDAQTVVGSVMGTPGYMAPEQAAGEDADERADVYAIGAVLYHVIAGAVPHQGATLDEVITRVIRGDIPPLLAREPRTPPDLAAIVGKAMALDKAARYPDAGELADDLRKFQTGKLVGAHHYTRGERIQRWLRRHRAIALVTAIATIVLVAGAAISIQRVVDARDKASRERDAAVEKSNRALLDQARAMRAEPARLLATLANLDETGPDWEAARMLAAEALAQPRLIAQTRGPAAAGASVNPSRAFELSRDGAQAFAFDHDGLWIMDLVAMRTQIVRYGNDPQASRRLVVCDDATRAYLVSDHALHPVLHRAELRKAVVTPMPGGVPELVAAIAQCNADFALVANETGLSWRDPASGATTTFSTEPMEAAWWTPDRQHVVALERMGALRRFARSGKPLGRIAVERPTIYPDRDRWLARSNAQAALSRDGKTVVTLAHGTHRFWSFEYESSAVPTLAKQIEGFVVAPDGSVAYLSTPTGGYEILPRARDPFDEVMPSVPRGALAISPDGAWLVGVQDGKVRFTDRAVVVERELRGHAGAERIAFTPDGRLVTAGADAVRVWDLGTPGRSHGRIGVHAAAFSPDGRWLAIDNGKTLARWDADRLVDEVALEASGSGVSSIAIASSGDVVYTQHDAVFRWSPRGPLQRLGVHPGAITLSSGLLPDLSPITVGFDRVVVWRPAGPQEIALPSQQAARRPGRFGLALDARGLRALVDCRPVGEAVRTCVVDLDQRRVRLIPGTTGLAAISPDGRLAITGADDDKCQIWDLDRLALINELASVGAVTELGISPDGTQGIIGGLNGVDRIELQTLRVIPLSPSRAAGRRLQWSPDSKTVVGDDLVMRDVATGELRELACPWCEAWHLSATALTVLTRWGIFRVADDLPREPAALKQRLLGLPYELDDHGALVVKPAR